MDGFIALYIFMLAAVTAYEMTSKTPAILHTSLASSASFINGIILVGAMTVMGNAESTTETILGFIAVVLASANVVGGYIITSRMLSMFNSNKSNDNSGDK